MTGPLQGISVIELGGIGPSAFACMLLADLGADVVRVDRPDAAVHALVPPEHDILNRGKRSLALDLKRPEAVAVVLTLAERADVVVEGFRPGVVERLGIGPNDVRARNPAAVYGRMTGWGQDGPLSPTAGHDLTYIAITGALHAIGDAGGPPQIPLTLVGDFAGGAMYLVTGLLAALLEARRSGSGDVVDAAIVDGVSHLLAAFHGMLGLGMWSDERGVNLLDGGSPYYSMYETADGRHVAVGAIEPQFYAELLRRLGLDEDPRAQNDRSDWPRLSRSLADAFRTRTAAEWDAVFEGSDACVAPVLGLREASLHPHLEARRTIVDTGGFPQPAPAPRFTRHALGPPARPPAIGQHSREVLAAIGAEELIDSGVAMQA